MNPKDSIILFRIALFAVPAAIIAFIDLRTFRIPNYCSLGGLITMLLYDLLTVSPDLASSCLAAALSAVVFLIISHATQGLGLGDVKYIAFIGFFSGLKYLPLVFLSSASLALLYMLAIGKGSERRDRVPFGPFLSLGGALAAGIMAFRHWS